MSYKPLAHFVNDVVDQLTGNYVRLPKYFTKVKVANGELSDGEGADLSDEHEEEPDVEKKIKRRGNKKREKYRRYKLFFVYDDNSIRRFA